VITATESTARGLPVDKQSHDCAHPEIQRLQGELRRAEEELSHFLYVTSHDFTEPLQIVLAYAELLTTGYAGQLDERADSYVAGIRTGAERIRALIDDLVVYSRLERRQPKIEEVDSLEVIEEAIEVLSERMEGTGATVRLDAHATVAADREELARVFRCLLDNAIKFRSDEPPEIRVLAAREENGWCFCVRDNGIGIDPAQHDRVFEMFQRLHTRDGYPGTGAGLAICKKIVQRHGGRIWVESATGLGATFYFTVPLRGHTH
jgi:chemotaxis family two-component system sensor kinase Cph1